MSHRAPEPVAAPAASWRATRVLGAGLPHFAGHFPGAPVLPGAAQLHALILPAVYQARPHWGPLRRATRLKFRRPLAPGDQITVHLAFDDSPGRVTFRIECEGVVCTSGVLELQVAAP